MKRPLSPSHPPGSGNSGGLVESTGLGCSPEQHTKREKKHPSFTLCEVCNIQLNSAVQAQIHYNGKSHQKRLKQLHKGKLLSSQGPAGHNSSLLTSLPLPGRSLHPLLDLKHFVTFRLNGTSALSLFPNFNTMDPVQKAVINHTFGVPNPLKKKQFISCNICHLRFNSANQAEAHYRGHKHARRLKAIEAAKSKQKVSESPSRGQEKPADLEATLDLAGDTAAQPNGLLGTKPPALEPHGLVPMSPPEESPAQQAADALPLASPPISEPSEGAPETVSVASSAAAPGAETPAAESGSTISSAPEGEKEGKKAKQHLFCPTCKVTVNSASQLDAHNSGAKHRLMLEGQAVLPRRGRGKVLSRAGHKPKRIGSRGIQCKAFQCQTCEIYVNSETQLKQHMSSRRHKDRLAGKPPKAKYSPYSKFQKSAALASKLALQKHLTKTLAARFLPGPFNPATVCALPGPLTLRPAATALFQAPLFGPALFRTQPSPVRAAAGPIVFAPY